MSVTLERLYNKTASLYDMKLLAGEAGMGNLVQWVHIVEDEAVTEFLHGRELIFTTGIRREDSNWLLQFAHRLYEADASGLIVNSGPYIKTIPREVIQFCNEEGFPLIEVPWKTKLVDVTRIYCSQIMKSEQKEESITSALKEIIFHPHTVEYQKAVLMRQGFYLDSQYTMTLISVEADESDANIKYYDIVKFHTEKIVKHNCDKYGIFRMDNMIVVIFSTIPLDKIEVIINSILKVCSDRSSYQIYAATADSHKGVEGLAQDYQIAKKMLILAKQQNRRALYYNKLGIYKLLMNGEDKDILYDFYQSSLGKLEEYDKSNGTDYVDFLNKYLHCGYSVQLLAELECIHRNTVHYKLNKIKGIIGNDLNDWETRFEMYVSFCIRDII